MLFVGYFYFVVAVGFDGRVHRTNGASNELLWEFGSLEIVKLQKRKETKRADYKILPMVTFEYSIY